MYNIVYIVKSVFNTHQIKSIQYENKTKQNATNKLAGEGINIYMYVQFVFTAFLKMFL